MGLDIAVGLLANLKRDDPEFYDIHCNVLAGLNKVLAKAGQNSHIEPDDLAPEHCFEAQMWGYSGLHHVRRLAAHLALHNEVPDPIAYNEAADDPDLQQYYDIAGRYLDSKPGGIFGRFKSRPVPPRFMHLIVHSDCEGFYLPRATQVICDDDNHESIGGFVGSSIVLSEEVDVLCAALSIPADLDPEDERVWENAESPLGSGPLWQLHGIETFVLTRLRKACQLSKQSGSAIVFI